MEGRGIFTGMGRDEKSPEEHCSSGEVDSLRYILRSFPQFFDLSLLVAQLNGCHKVCDKVSEESADQLSDALERIAVCAVDHAVDHRHVHHAAGHLCHRTERHVVLEQGVEVRNAAL